MKRACITALLCLSLLPCMGFGPLDPAGMNPTALGMAGAGVATSAGTAALFINPAGLAAHRAHNVEVGVSRNPLSNDTTFFAQSVDGQAPGYVKGGVSYGYTKRTGPDGTRWSGHDVRSGAALSGQSAVASYLLGVSHRYLSLEPSGGGDAELSGWGIDAGLAVAMAGNVRLGLVWRNVMTPDPTNAPEQLAAGLGLSFSGVVVAADGAWWLNEAGATYRVGAAVSVTQWLQLRAGYKYVDVEAARAGTDAVGHGVTGGVGVRIERWNLGAAVGVPLNAADQWQFVASASYFLPSVR